MMELPAGLPTALVDRLAKVAGMLGSDHDGERAAAALQATRIIREAGWTWRDVIEAAGPRSAPARPREPRKPRATAWRKQLAACAARPWHLTDWEFDFVASLRRWGKRPSAKQMAILDRLFEKVCAP